MTARRPLSEMPPLPASPWASRSAATRSLACLLLAAALTGQQSPLLPQNPGAQAGAFNPFTPSFVVPQSQDTLTPRWMEQRQQQTFTGFPVFPSRLSAYGNYPAAAGAGPGGLPMSGASLMGLLGGKAPPPVGQLPVSPLAQMFGQAQGGLPGGVFPFGLPAAEPTDGWPAWASLRSREPLPYAPDLGLLVRHVDRVWWRAPDEEAAVPLYFHDKFRTLRAGAEVEVRQTGEFEVLLHNTSRITCRGQAALRVEELTPERVRLTLSSLTRVQVRGTNREHIVQLPDGSRLVFPAAGADAGSCEVLLQRPAEPGWLGGRATMFNLGQRDVLWTHATGTVTLPPNHRLLFFLTPSLAPIQASFIADGASPEFVDGGVQVQAPEGAVVRWSGARFTLPAGAALEIDPLQGGIPGAPNPDIGQ